MIRKMGNIEQAQTLVNDFASAAAIGVLRLRHLPPPEEVQIAFNALQKRHPMLQMHITRQAGDLFFETPSDLPPIPLTVNPEAAGDSWLAVVQEALNRKIPDQAPLLCCYYLQLADSPDTVDLITVFHHAMMDAFSGINLLEELLLLLSDEWQEPLPSMALPDPCDSRFPSAFEGLNRVGRMTQFMLRQMGDELSYRKQSRNGRFPPIHKVTNCIPLTRTLSVDDTRALSRAVRKQGITMNSAVSAAQLLAVHKYLYPHEARPLRTMIFANLRPYLNPPVAPDTLGCYITPTRQTVPLSAAPDFWQVAHAIQDDITSAMRRGDGFLFALMSKQLVQMTNRRQAERLSATAISYVGALTMRPRYGEIEVVDLHAFLANNRLGPEFAAFCQIFQGSLAWDFVFFDEDMETETAVAIADETCALLQQVE